MILEKVMYVPDLCMNLILIVKCLKNGWKIGNENEVITLKKGEKMLRFDQQLKTANGQLFGVN